MKSTRASPARGLFGALVFGMQRGYVWSPWTQSTGSSFLLLLVRHLLLVAMHLFLVASLQRLMGVREKRPEKYDRPPSWKQYGLQPTSDMASNQPNIFLPELSNLYNPRFAFESLSDLLSVDADFTVGLAPHLSFARHSH